MKNGIFWNATPCVRIDVSEERSGSFIKEIRIGELGTTLSVTSNRRTLRRNNTGCSKSSGTSVLTRATRCNIQDDVILHTLRCEKLKST
jgi:hypothetical protein